MTASAVARLGMTIAMIIAGECAVLGLAVAPVAAAAVLAGPAIARLPPLAGIAVVSLAAGPAYLVFALGVLWWSIVLTRLTGARTPTATEMRIVDYEWPLLNWARAMTAAHVARIFGGTLFRGSPVWSAYLRLSGAGVGRGVYVNTTFVSDFNLLAFGDGAVIGSDVHLSGHTVEAGLVKTGRVRLGAGVTIGLGSVIDIDVEAGDGCQIGALSLVPKHSRLEAHAVYAGIPIHRLR